MVLPSARPELVVAALLYLVSAHRARPCPALASCIARHFAMLAHHPDAHRMIREVASASVQTWTTAADMGQRSLKTALH